MGRYDEYIGRLCKNRGIFDEQARLLALSKAVEDYYKEEERDHMSVLSTYNPFGECK